MILNYINWTKRIVLISILILILGLIPNLSADNRSIDNPTQTSLENKSSELDLNGLHNRSSNNIDNHQALKIQGMDFYDQERFDLALESFDKAETLYPTDPDMPYLLGITHFMLGNISEAEPLLNRSLAHNPDPSAFFYHGLCAYALNDYNQSVISFQRYLTLEPEDSYAWFNLGQAYEEVDMLTDAIHAYQSAVRIDPDYAKPWFFIGTLYYSHGYNQNAKEAILNYTRLMPRDDTGWFFLSSLCYKDGERNESIAAIQKAISIRPDEPLYRDYLLQYDRNSSANIKESGKTLQTPLSPFLSVFATLSLFYIRRFLR